MGSVRKLSEGDIYHIVHRGVGRQLIFEDDEDRVFFLECAKERFSSAGIELFCWCLMSNHFHLLLHGDMCLISSAMRKLCSTYALWFNARHGRIGHLFQDRFKSAPINEDGYLLTVVRYIHRNPEAAGICGVADYRWSSYGEYMGLVGNGICTTDFVLSCFGGRDAFAESHQWVCDSDECLDVSDGRNKTRAMKDEAAIALAESLLGEGVLEQLKSRERGERDWMLATLSSAGLSIRQIERLTGVGRGIVARAVKKA